MISKEKGKPFLGDDIPYLAAGINPKTGSPINVSNNVVASNVLSNISRFMKIMDETQAINRYNWYNLPSGLTGDLIERILYYRAQGILFYMDSNKTFYFLPYALSGEIDVYGRFLTVTPLPFNGTASTKDDNSDKEKAWIVGLQRKPIYDRILPDEVTEEMLLEGCVILTDYDKGISQTNIARSVINDQILKLESEAFPIARTSLIAHSGIKAMGVADENTSWTVKEASKSILDAAICGDTLIPIVSALKLQDIANSTGIKTEEFLMYMQALDNFRLQGYGIDNGGLFEKKAHMLEKEQEMNSNNVGLIYNAGLKLRQDFCNKVNTIWGLDIWCEPSETVTNVDQNGTGIIADEEDQSGEDTAQTPEINDGGESDE